MKQVNIFYGYLLLKVETPTIDANKHPMHQIEDLVKILEESGDYIEIYSNSPYVLFYLTVIHAYVNNNKIPSDKNPFNKIKPFINKHFEIKENAEVIEGTYYNGMINDENLLNDFLGKGNEDFSKYLELEDEYI